MSASTLSSLLWWVAIGGFFFWMMRKGGCGMSHGAGGHDHGAEHEHGSGPGAASGRPIDPVCGMGVDPERAVGTRLVSGRTFFFCSQTCLDAFDKNPAAYAQDRPAGSASQHMHSGS